MRTSRDFIGIITSAAFTAAEGVCHVSYFFASNSESGSPQVGVKFLHLAVGYDFVVVEAFDDEAFEGAGAAEGDVGLAVVEDAAEVDEEAIVGHALGFVDGDAVG